MNENSFFRKVAPVVTLFILSPLIAELFSSSIPVSRVGELVYVSFFYGPAVLLIREIARRYNPGWFSIILLGFAYGIIEESLVLQSTFNPNFLNYDVSTGRLWGVNWFEAEIIITNHAFFSITIPILFAETIFHKRKNQLWLNNWGIAIMIVLFLLSSISLHSTFTKMSGYSASCIHFVIASLVVLILIFSALIFKKGLKVKYSIKTPPVLILGIISFVISLYWLSHLIIVFTKDHSFPAWLAELSGLLVISVSLILILGWMNNKWQDIHRYSIACGALSATLLFGLYILVSKKNMVDIISQVCFIVIVGLLIILFAKRINNKNLAKPEN